MVSFPSFVNAAFLKRRANQWRVRHPSFTALADSAGAVQWPHVSITRTSLHYVYIQSQSSAQSPVFVCQAAYQEYFLTKHSATEVTFILNSHTPTPYTYTCSVHVFILWISLQTAVQNPRTSLKSLQPFERGTLHVACVISCCLPSTVQPGVWKKHIIWRATNCSAVHSLSQSPLDIPS